MAEARKPRQQEAEFTGFAPQATARDSSWAPGAYPATLTSITQIETKYGPKNKLYWRLDDAHGDSIVVNELCDPNLSIQGKFMRRIAAVNGRKSLSDGENLSQLRTKGGRAMVWISVDDQGYNQVDDVDPIPNAMTQAARAAQADPGTGELPEPVEPGDDVPF